MSNAENVEQIKEALKEAKISDEYIVDVDQVNYYKTIKDPKDNLVRENAKRFRESGDEESNNNQRVNCKKIKTNTDNCDKDSKELTVIYHPLKYVPIQCTEMYLNSSITERINIMLSYSAKMSKLKAEIAKKSYIPAPLPPSYDLTPSMPNLTSLDNNNGGIYISRSGRQSKKCNYNDTMADDTNVFITDTNGINDNNVWLSKKDVSLKKKGSNEMLKTEQDEKNLKKKNLNECNSTPSKRKKKEDDPKPSTSKKLDELYLNCPLCGERFPQNKIEEWKKRGLQNVIKEPLVKASDILLPSFRIKLGLMKQFVKALVKDFGYLAGKFPQISKTKLKEGIFDGLQIHTMFKNNDFITKMNDTERAAWLSFKKVSENFLGNYKSEDYPILIQELLTNYKQTNQQGESLAKRDFPSFPYLSSFWRFKKKLEGYRAILAPDSVSTHHRNMKRITQHLVEKQTKIHVVKNRQASKMGFFKDHSEEI